MATPLKIGDTVRLTRTMLKLGMPDIKGAVVGITENPLRPRVIQVAWQGFKITNCLECNLLRADRVHLEAV